VNNRITQLEVCSTRPKAEDMETEEDTKVVEDIEVEEGVKEHLAEDKDQSSIITTDSRVTSCEIVRRLHVPIVKL
jgi:hypothetical protein